MNHYSSSTRRQDTIPFSWKGVEGWLRENIPNAPSFLYIIIFSVLSNVRLVMTAPCNHLILINSHSIITVTLPLGFYPLR